MNVLLDTNIVVAYLSDSLSLPIQISSTAFSVSVVVVGELEYGAKKSTRVGQNLSRVERFLSTVSVLSIDAETARIFGDVKVDLMRKGRPIPDNDIWIAATALQHHLMLITRDAHFEHVDQLDIEKW